VTKTVRPVSAAEQTIVQAVTFYPMRGSPPVEPRFNYFSSIRNPDFLQHIKTSGKVNCFNEIDFVRSKHINYSTHQNDVKLNAAARGMEFF